ncbi:dTDP-4-dehydrorhamnose 3,5-epimerase [Taibaiella lutea]|uniref:dTDP-4-dehydrorhamnose 3,5-epimerase n=1 Tax=Taibaiella lutea TaxID=2608001 RepID=A0A5M6CPB3_9BACT|nr:dTDP-4-dehydrorhamnose 3,5-epimerase [Taibaiella lutea]KAA5536240.1 dTDP-4-dehydrorhamnose 3,5-epimerase [Taibaiella lutea]
MKATATKLKDCFIIESAVFKDKRGFFFESFNRQKFEDAIGQSGAFVQDNISVSGYGVIRGLHFQMGEHAQAKLVQVLQGAVLDVAVDLREKSETFGQYFAIELSADNNLQLYIPRGFAHGFSVLSETAMFSYKCDNFYNKASESGIRYDDPKFNIDWKIPMKSAEISEKDVLLGDFQSAYIFK